MANPTRAYIFLSLIIVYTKPVARMRFGAGMTVVAEILTMTLLTGITILLNIQLMSFHPLGIKG